MHLANKLFFLICTLSVIGSSVQAQNDDKLSEFVDFMHLLTRLTNGISLEAGLISGSIPSDDVITEFLHMGSLKLEDYLKTNTTQLNTSISTISNLHGSLNSSIEIDAIEARFTFLDNIRKKVLNIGDLANLQGKEAYEKSVKELESVKINVTMLGNLFGNLNNIQKNIREIRNMSITKLDTDDDKSKKLKRIQAMKANFGILKNDLKKFEEVGLEIKKLKSFQNDATLFLQPLFDEMDARNEYIIELTSGTKIQLDLLNNNIQKFQEASTIFKESQGLLIPIQSLIAAKIDEQQWTRKYSSGFQNGFVDLKQLPNDAENDHLKLVINMTDNDWITQHLLKAFSFMGDFERNLSVLDVLWEPISSQNSLDSLNSVDKIQKQIAQYADIILLEKFKYFEECDKFTENSTSKAQSVDKISDIQNATTVLNETLVKLISFDYNKTNTLDYSSLINFKKLNDDKDLEPLRKLFNESEKLLRILETDLPGFKVQIAKIPYLIKNIHNINKYQKSLKESGYLNFYSCLNDTIGAEEEVVLRVIKEIQDVRMNGQNWKSQEALAVVNLFSTSLGDLEKLKNFGKAMKDVSKIEVVALKDSIFKDSLTVTDKLAKSVQGLSQIKKVAEIRNDLEALMGDVTFVKETAEKQKINLKQDEYDNLFKFENLSKTLKELFLKIDALKATIEKLEVTKFSGFSSVFKISSEIPNIDENVKSLKESLESLLSLSKADPTLQKNIDSLVKCLDILEPLNLNFSSFEIASGIRSLEDLDLFFASFNKAIPPAPTEPPTTVPSTETTPLFSTTSSSIEISGNTMKQIQNTTESSMPEWQIGIIVVVGLIVVAAILLLILSYCCKWFCFKNKKGKSQLSSSDNEPDIILPPVSSVPAAESLYIPPPSMYQPIPIPPPPPPTMGQQQQKRDASSVGTAQLGPHEFPPAHLSVEVTQENETKTKTVDEAVVVKSKEVVDKPTGSKETASKGSKSTSKEETKMKPSQEVL